MNRYKVEQGMQVNLGQWNPNDKSEYDLDKTSGKQMLKELNRELEALQELLFAEGKHKVLVVLQALDTGGKDGTIRNVFEGVNPQGVKAASFGRPTEEELGHDYLWRVHKHTPKNGEIVIFNRSHYEDVLVVRVHNFVEEDRWRKRYTHIKEFERILADEGTTILKFYLNISKDEQKERLISRLDLPEKNWKFNKDDLKERKLWPEYMKAYEAVLSETSTDYAPWYIVPANRKWYRNLVIATVIVETLKSLKMEFPPAEDGLDEIVVE